MKVLAIDDEPAILASLRMILLEMPHCELDCVNSVMQAMDLTKEKEYDFIFVDLKMPGQDGVWFVKNAALPRKTKVLLLTAYLNRSALNELFRCGISGYLTKPFDRDDVLRHLAFHSLAQQTVST